MNFYLNVKPFLFPGSHSFKFNQCHKATGAIYYTNFPIFIFLPCNYCDQHVTLNCLKPKVEMNKKS